LIANSKEADEKFLVEAAQKDPSLFAELYEKNFERVYAFIASRIRNRAEAEDLTSEVFHKALANLKRFEWRGVPFIAWLLRIASNTIADRWQNAAREYSDPVVEKSTEITPEDVEQKAQVFRLVSMLPEVQRRVLMKRFVEGRSIREIAHELQRTEGAVKQLQFRAVQSLRSRMGETND
jgi:RNA polymerase sigma-70 factor, ECF subfamily